MPLSSEAVEDLLSRFHELHVGVVGDFCLDAYLRVDQSAFGIAGDDPFGRHMRPIMHEAGILDSGLPGQGREWDTHVENHNISVARPLGAFHDRTLVLVAQRNVQVSGRSDRISAHSPAAAPFLPCLPGLDSHASRFPSDSRSWCLSS